MLLHNVVSPTNLVKYKGSAFQDVTDNMQELQATRKTLTQQSLNPRPSCSVPIVLSIVHYVAPKKQTKKTKAITIFIHDQPPDSLGMS